MRQYVPELEATMVVKMVVDHVRGYKGGSPLRGLHQTSFPPFLLRRSIQLPSGQPLSQPFFAGPLTIRSRDGAYYLGSANPSTLRRHPFIEASFGNEWRGAPVAFQHLGLFSQTRQRDELVCGSLFGDSSSSHLRGKVEKLEDGNSLNTGEVSKFQGSGLWFYCCLNLTI